MFSFSLDIYPGGELLDHRVVLFLEFSRNSILFSIAYIPTNSGEVLKQGVPVGSQLLIEVKAVSCGLMCNACT